MAWCLYTFSFGQYYDYGTFEASESSLNAPGTSSSSGAEPTAHWDSWGPEQPANPWNAVTFELAANAWCAEPLPHQAVPLVPKAASVDASQVAPNTPPLEAEAEAPDRVAEWAQGKVAELEAKSGPKPPSTDPLQYFAQAQAHVPLVIDR